MVTIFFLCTPPPPSRRPITRSSRATCECYVISDDPAGVNVRSGPGAQYPVIGTLPTGPGVVVSPRITGSVGEWLRIEDIWVGEWPEESIHPRFPDSGPLKLTGWVSGPVLGVQTQWPEEYDSSTRSAVVPLHEEPATGSAVLIRVKSWLVVPVVGCRGEWVKVRYRGVEGWLAPLNWGVDSEG